MVVGVPLGGAERRLLPLAFPLIAVTLVSLSLTTAWGVLVVWPETPFTLLGGPGPGLAAIHAVTVGVLVMTVILVVPQILPVITMQDTPSAWVLAPVYLLIGGGLPILIHGFLAARVEALAAGVGAICLGGLLFLGVWAHLLWRARASGLGDVLLGNLLALVGLLVVLLLGAALALDYTHAFLPDHQTFAGVHALLAIQGLMGSLVMGFSLVLVPMLAVATPPRRNEGRPALILQGVSLAVSLLGAIWPDTLLSWMGGAGLLVAAGLHLRIMAKVMKRRLRPRLGPSFWLVRLSWVCWIAGLACAAAARLDWLPVEWAGLFLLPGWLLSLLLGLLQRIVPFLASMQSVRLCARPAPLPRLEPKLPPPILGASHGGALFFLALGMALDLDPLIRVAGLLGMVSGLTLLSLLLIVLVRGLSHHRTVGPKRKASQQ
ncbi:MAG: hypothetical protein K9H25_04620 [Rhodospirillum sp.]|nr:hypothetical protein [Rhodospirillum sp.]MCF8488379.1 hypothetical protein [Rhodospirillum sp.]MCF8500611.1 hypothetical protein [Rhodospirillum sp.]